MQHSRFVLNDGTVSPMPVGAEDHTAGFIFCPAFLWAGQTWEQIAWRRWVYQQAWAQAASLNVQEFKACAAEMPHAWRN